MPFDFALETEGLVKSYNTTRVVDGVDLQVGKGEIVGFLGPNGAGKTTVMNIVTGLVSSDSGEVRLLGVKDGFRRPDVRRRLGCLQEKPRVYPEMTAREYLGFFADLYGVSDAATGIDEVLDRVALREAADRPLSAFSRGMQQRACLARSLLHRPEFLILDEPTLGLDPNGVSEMRRIFRDLRDDGVTLLFSSHQLDEMERICDSVIFLRCGKVVAAGRPADILPSLDETGSLELELFEPVAGHVNRIRSLNVVRGVSERDVHTLSIQPELPEGVSKREARGVLAQAISGLGLTVLSVTDARASLEDLFLKLTGDGGVPNRN